MTKQCKLLRDYRTTQSRLNEEELRIYLKEHNYKMKETYGKHYTNLDEMKKHFNNWSNVKERITLDGLVYALCNIAIDDKAIILRRKKKTINGKPATILTNVYK